jgi:hypothetical protein
MSVTTNRIDRRARKYPGFWLQPQGVVDILHLTKA